MLGLLIVIVPSRVSTEGEDGGWTMNARADVSTRNLSPEEESREKKIVKGRLERGQQAAGSFQQRSKIETHF